MTGGKKALWKDQELADTITAEAVRFIRESAGNPIFIYFCSNDIHVPRDPHPRYRGKSQLGIRGDATVQMDDNLGSIYRALQEAGYGDDALIIFTSDNGPVISDGYLDGADADCKGHTPAAPCTGGKYGIKEGGTRVPFIVHWPAGIRPGTSNALLGQVDLARTLGTLVGATIPQEAFPDSTNQLPALLGQDKEGRVYLVEQAHGDRLALRWGAHKYVPGKQAQLYYLENDIQEQHNIAPQHPEMVHIMQDMLNKIRKTTDNAMHCTKRVHSFPNRTSAP
jgi:arylsulfatase A-like enzyme